ncbi:MAG: LLM class flavin-dependent oxidoreductase [Proteobacteria bacterium]|nr:MAG: LLM class flavin-dependent oxidoreductase [Pseudomonadota bacterium]
MTKISVLDLVRVKQGADSRAALDESRDLAVHLEKLGYPRIWISEHHNTTSIASAATSLVLAHIGAATSQIRLASGGIMLPNHAPYIIAEQFGTLERMFPGRVDLGLGRAPGTDQLAVQAMRRPHNASDGFPEDVLELQKYFNPQTPGQRLVASPAEGTKVPLTILGSSLFGAGLAARYGLPFGFASHFSPDMIFEALKVYREGFKPSKQLDKPYAMVGVNVIVAATDQEAERLFTSQLKSFMDYIGTGNSGPLGPPIDDIDNYGSIPVRSHVNRMLACSIVGSKETVRLGLESLVNRTSADELIVVSDIFDKGARHHSFELLASIAHDSAQFESMQAV